MTNYCHVIPHQPHVTSLSSSNGIIRIHGTQARTHARNDAVSHAAWHRKAAPRKSWRASTAGHSHSWSIAGVNGHTQRLTQRPHDDWQQAVQHRVGVSCCLATATPFTSGLCKKTLYRYRSVSHTHPDRGALDREQRRPLTPQPCLGRPPAQKIAHCNQCSIYKL